MQQHFSERRSYVRQYEMIETNTLRRRLGRAIETMIAALDALDDDVDLEPDNDDERGADDEPWLGAVERHPSGERGWTPFLRRDKDGSQIAWSGGETDDREFDDADDEDGGDREASCEDEGAEGHGHGDLLDRPALASSWEPIRSAIDPRLMPDLYFMTGEGDCCDPVIKNGDRVLISKTEPIRPGDFVVIYLDRKFVPRGEHQVLLKRLVVDGRVANCKLPNGRPALLVETLNPRQQFAIPADAVVATHRMLRVDNDTPAPRLSPADFLINHASKLKAAAPAKGAA